MNDLPLSKLRVIDFTHVLAGPTCTMVLADLGAEVIKIEAPKGDDSRKFGPFQNDASAYYNSINRNKLGICLNLKTHVKNCETILNVYFYQCFHIGPYCRNRHSYFNLFV